MPNSAAYARGLAFVRTLRLQSGEMPMQQVDVLLSIAARPGLTMADLAKQAGLAQSSVSRNIAALSTYHRAGQPGLGFVEAVIDPREPRRRLVYLTQAGRVFVSKLMKFIEPTFSMDPDTEARLENLDPHRVTDLPNRTGPAKVKVPRITDE